LVGGKSYAKHVCLAKTKLKNHLKQLGSITFLKII
jgi:hypothetical protein